MFVEKRRFGAAAIAAFLSAIAAAQDVPASAETRRAEAERRAFEDLETTFITATRTNLRREASPQQSFELSADVVIEEDLARTFADAFRRLPGTLVQKTSASQSSPYLRGFTGYHTLLMMDGVRLNDSTLRSGPNDLWSAVDAYSVGEAEIVFGPASVLYGSDAVGGAVNVVPKHRTRFGEGWDWDRRVIFRGATGERSLSFRVENEGNVGDDFGFFVGATYQPFGRIDGGGSTGPQPTTGYENLGGDAVFDVRFDDNWTLRLTAQTFDVSDGWRTHSTIFGTSFAGSTIGTDQRRVLDFRRDLLAATVEGRDLGGFVDGARFQLSYKGYAEREDRIAGSGARTWQGFDVDTFGAAFHLVSETGLGTFTYGADWYHDDVDSFRDNFNAAGVQTASSVQGPVGDDAKYDLVGAFVQDEIRATDELSVILGARFTYAAAAADRVALDGASSTVLGAPIDDDFLNVAGSARFVWKVDDDATLFGGVSQAFRAPNLSDLTRLDIARSGELEQPQPGLDPEDFLSFEIGGRATFGDFTAEAAYYHVLMDDVVIRRPTATMVGTNTVVVKSNDGEGHVQGVDVALGYRFDDQWSARGTFTWQDGQLSQYATTTATTTVDEAPSRLSPLQGMLAVRWTSEDRDFWVEPYVRLSDRQDRLNSGDRRDTQRFPPNGTPGFVIWGVHAGARVSENVTLFGGVDNVFDKDYRIHGSGVQEPGFNAVIGAEVTF